MNLEEAIQQRKPFKSQHQRAIANMLFTNNWLMEQIREQLKPYDITLQQYNVLRILKGAGAPISTCIIRERMLDKMSDASRMVHRLSKKGLVDRKACCHDKRLVDISLSKEGEELLTQILSCKAGFDCLLQNLSEDEARQLNELLDKARC